MIRELASYAMRDEDTEGRRVFEPKHPYRSEYQRDRDRVIHTKAFRRLEQKTQVFGPGYCDHFRNRLTHTLEVSQIARTLAEAMGLNSRLAEALALSHDIGHPPFSHEGELALDRIMRRHGSGFDHNLHALSIVEYFEERYVAFPGLNLTFEVREGIIKHSRDWPPDVVTYVDIGEYRLGQRPPLEAQLIDFADEIAYNSADLDDGYESGLLELAQIRAEVPLFERIYQRVEAKYPDSEEKLKVSESVRGIIDALASSLIRSTSARLKELRIESVDDIRRFPERLVGFEPEFGDLNSRLKSFLHKRLYDHQELKRARREAQKVVEELFNHYLGNPESLPPSHYRRIGERDLRHVVCDYIAGMTDTFAYARHGELRAG
jgi:dGTPase